MCSSPVKFANGLNRVPSGSPESVDLCEGIRDLPSYQSERNTSQCSGVGSVAAGAAMAAPLFKKWQHAQSLQF